MCAVYVLLLFQLFRQATHPRSPTFCTTGFHPLVILSAALIGSMDQITVSCLYLYITPQA
jgi:hypothetical protein